MLAFRDWLRTHDDDRELYLSAKRELAAREWKYVQNYADAKSAVVEDPRACAAVSLVLGIPIVVLVDAVAIAAILLVRRRAPEGSYFSDGDRASAFSGAPTGFAIFAGFVIFLLFTTYDQSRAGAEAEALLVVQQFETAQFLAPETRDRLEGELISTAARSWRTSGHGGRDWATRSTPGGWRSSARSVTADTSTVPRRRPSRSGSIRLPPGRRRGATASTGQSASLRRPSGSCSF